MKRLFRVTLLALAVPLLSGSLAAADAKWYDKVAVSGFMDSYYQFNYNGLSNTGPVPSVSPTSSAYNDRSFDTRQNEFVLNAVKIGATYADLTSQTGAEIDLLYGPMAKAVNSLTGQSELFMVEQAYLTKGFGPVSLKFGKMVTHMGNEVIDTPSNWNYGRSLLFYQVPLFHVGLCVSYAPLDGLTLMAGAFNGNSVDQASSEAKEYGAQVAYSGVKNLSLVANYYLAVTKTAGLFDNTNEIDLIGTFQALDSLAFAGEYLYITFLPANDKLGDDYVLTGTASQPVGSKSQGYALYAKYDTPFFGLSLIPRWEQMFLPDAGYVEAGTGLAKGLVKNSATVTVKYPMGPLTGSLEFRQDTCTQPIYANRLGSPNLYFQDTLTLGATYSF